jgi:transposase-like protein
MRITQTYTDEFRADALQLVLKGNRSVMGVAADLRASRHRDHLDRRIVTTKIGAS